MKIVVNTFTYLMTALLALCLSHPIVRAADTPASGGNTAAPQKSGARSQGQVNPQIEKQRQQAEQQAAQTLDKDAMAAIQEAQNALKALEQNKPDDALPALERASGKINVLLGRNPATALLPVKLEVEAIDAAPQDTRAIKALARAVEDAVKENDYPKARVLLQGLISEIRVRTYNLPLATYPLAIRDAARLIEQKKINEAKAVLQTALNTLAVIDRVTPLPIATAQLAINDAQAQRDKDKQKAEQLLAVAKAELERAKELGYAGKDPEYQALNQAISDIERQLKGNENTDSAFAKLKEKVGSFFKRQSESEKKAEVASR
jgi:hypothetical protein